MIFIEHISADDLFRDMPTNNGTQRRLELVVRHIFQRTGSTAIIRSVLLFGGVVESSYEALELIMNTLYHRRATIHAITSRTADNQRRNFLDAIILIRLQLNPETLFIGDIEQVAYQVSIVVTIDHPDNSGCLMISQIREINRRYFDLLHMVILDARSDEVLVSGQRSILNDSWSLYPNPISNYHQLLVARMAVLMGIVENMKPISLDESFDEVDIDDSISDDEEGDI
ncbi:unnamed protein product [Rotaria sp. Silwood2]|nr:unnamed protein product [Rotaria sp. Silwood2]CAF2684948.1 unnamed protein product [Rotaria sp. Silwood2]CAF3314742.1 unnamed protein product [Rotaria sp. Silwood2]CAF4373345.1 unnamed protein product [Rotaria sp. Silwood2]